jgi:hypothetical protein
MSIILTLLGNVSQTAEGKDLNAAFFFEIA